MKISDSSSPDAPSRSVAPRKLIELTGPSVPVDPRLHAVRRDLAEYDLADRVFAQQYAVPIVARTVRAVPIHEMPRADAEVVATLVLGTSFHVLDVGREWAWGRGDMPGSVGYVIVDALMMP